MISEAACTISIDTSQASPRSTRWVGHQRVTLTHSRGEYSSQCQRRLDTERHEDHRAHFAHASPSAAPPGEQRRPCPALSRSGSGFVRAARSARPAAESRAAGVGVRGCLRRGGGVGGAGDHDVHLADGANERRHSAATRLRHELVVEDSRRRGKLLRLQRVTGLRRLRRRVDQVVPRGAREMEPDDATRRCFLLAHKPRTCGSDAKPARVSAALSSVRRWRRRHGTGRSR